MHAHDGNTRAKMQTWIQQFSLKLSQNLVDVADEKYVLTVTTPTPTTNTKFQLVQA